MNRKLARLRERTATYQEFEAEAMRYLKWYAIPRDWTRKDLMTFYIGG